MSIESPWDRIVSPWDVHRKSLRYHRKTYELGSQSTYLRLKSRILSLFKPYYIAVDFIQHIISLSNSLNQEVKLPLPLFRGDGREVRKCSTFVLITDPLYLPLKRGGLVCPLLESPRNVLLKYCKTLSISLFRKQANCLSLFRGDGRGVP